MKETIPKVSDSLIIAIITHIYLGWGFLFLIDVAVDPLTHNAYLGIFPALVIILPFFWIAADLSRMYPGQKLSAIFSRVYGKIGGKAISLIYICFLFFFLVMALKNTQMMVFSYFFRKTPFPLITLLFLGGALYNALGGIKSVGRLAVFMLIPPLIVIFGLELLGLNNINPVNVQPLIAGNFSQWFTTTINLGLILLPSTAIFVYLPYIKNSKSIIKICLISLGIVIPLFSVALLGTIGAFGPELTHKMSWSLVEYFHLIDYPYLLLEQAGLFFLIAWYPFHFVGTSQGLFVIGNELNVIFPKIKREWHTVAISVIVFALVNLPFNIIILADFFNKYQRWITYSYLSVLLGTWLTARLRSGNPGKLEQKEP